MLIKNFGIGLRFSKFQRLKFQNEKQFVVFSFLRFVLPWPRFRVFLFVHLYHWLIDVFLVFHSPSLVYVLNIVLYIPFWKRENNDEENLFQTIRRRKKKKKQRTWLGHNSISSNRLEVFSSKFFLFSFVFLNVVYSVVRHSNFVRDRLNVVFHVAVAYLQIRI